MSKYQITPDRSLYDFADDQRRALINWLDRYHINYNEVPLNVPITVDEEARTVGVIAWVRDEEGRPIYLGDQGFAKEPRVFHFDEPIERVPQGWPVYIFGPKSDREAVLKEKADREIFEMKRRHGLTELIAERNADASA